MISWCYQNTLALGSWYRGVGKTRVHGNLGRGTIEEHPTQSGLWFFLGQPIQRGNTLFVIFLRGGLGGVSRTVTPVIVEYDDGDDDFKDVASGDSVSVSNDCN